MYMMKKNLTQYTPLLTLVFIACVVGAYSTPTTTAPGGNTASPFTEGTTLDIKNSGFSLGGSLQALGTATSGSAVFAQDLAVKTQINGGRTNNISSTFTIGSTTTATNLEITGTLETSTFVAESLKPKQTIEYQTVVDSSSRTVLRKLCSDPQGGIVLCPAQPGGFCGDGVVNVGEDCDEKTATTSCSAVCFWNTGRTGAWSNIGTKSCYTGSGAYQCAATENCISNTCRVWVP